MPSKHGNAQEVVAKAGERFRVACGRIERIGMRRAHSHCMEPQPQSLHSDVCTCFWRTKISSNLYTKKATRVNTHLLTNAPKLESNAIKQCNYLDTRFMIDNPMKSRVVKKDSITGNSAHAVEWHVCL
jgi:hypothetical protein